MILLVFIDGIGMGTPGAHNPFDGAPIEILAPLDGVRPAKDGVSIAAIDASLGYPGLPQSATGQTVLFTGDDAMNRMGGHLSGAPTPTLTRMLMERSFLARARERGQKTAFLNAYDDARANHLRRVSLGEEPRKRRYPPSASSLAALAGGGVLRTFEDVRAGRAATFDLTGEVLRAFSVDAPRVSLEDAGRAVARGAREVDLALFELFLTDKAGHEQDMTFARHEIVRTDRFLSALFRAIDPETDTVFVTSDHGNLEDLSTHTHTHAKVPLLGYGAHAHRVKEARSLIDIVPLIEALTPSARPRLMGDSVA